MTLLSPNTTKKWDERFIQAARTVASWSPDPSSKIGAIAVSQQFLPLSWGFNAFPRHLPLEEADVDREKKYKWIVHAEMNAIYNANREAVSLRDSTFYIWGIPPCIECAKGLVQVGATRIVSVVYPEVSQHWLDSFKNDSMTLFDEANIKVEVIETTEIYEN
jgi:dCMP deaminase